MRNSRTRAVNRLMELGYAEVTVRKALVVGFLAAAAAVAQGPQTPPAVRTGPAVGETIPTFSATDQNGRTQTLASIAGPKGAMLVFFRSADW